MADATSAGFSTFLQCDKYQAIHLFTEHLQNDPKDYDSLLYRGISYGIVQNVSCAISDFSEAAKYGNPCQKMVADAHRLLYEGNTEDAIITIHQATQQFPLDPIGWHFYATFRSLSNVRDDATIAAFEKAIELDFPQAALSNYYLGEIMLLRNNDDAAMKYMKEAVRLNDTFAPAYLELGNILAKLREDNDAVQYYKKALELNSSLTQARKALERLEGSRGGGRRGGDSGGGDSGGGSNNDKAGKYGGGGGGGRRGGGGDNSGDGSNNEKAGKLWGKMTSNANKCQQLHKRPSDAYRKYVRTLINLTGKGQEEVLISWDTAKHGGAQFKVYTMTNTTAEFRGSLDHELKLMTGKHESQEGTSFRLDDLKPSCKINKRSDLKAVNLLLL